MPLFFPHPPPFSINIAQTKHSAPPTTPTPTPPSYCHTKQDIQLTPLTDASKVPPSRFQKRKGSIYAVPNSRDGKIDSNYAAKYYQKLAELGYAGHGHGHRKESH